MKSMLLRIAPVLVIVSMLLASCAAPVPVVPVVVIAPSATPEPSLTPAPSATNVAPPSDDVWDRIVANQKIVVGVAWDYPPFASVDPNFQVVGFDIALIEEIGRRCTEVESGARNVDNILTNTLLPEISRQLLTRIAEGQKLESVQVNVGPDGSFVYA